MFSVKNFPNDTNSIKVAEKGPFSVIEYKQDLSVHRDTAMMYYYMKEMNIRKRKVVAHVGLSGITIQAGAMQWSPVNNWCQRCR